MRQSHDRVVPAGPRAMPIFVGQGGVRVLEHVPAQPGHAWLFANRPRSFERRCQNAQCTRACHECALSCRVYGASGDVLANRSTQIR